MQNAAQPHRRIRLSLSRGLTWWQAVGCGIEVIVAAGVLILLVPAVAVSGARVPLAFLLASFLAIVNGGSYAILARGLAHAGGAYPLIRNRLGAGGLAGLLAQGAGQYLGALVAEITGIALQVE